MKYQVRHKCQCCQYRRGQRFDSLEDAIACASAALFQDDLCVGLVASEDLDGFAALATVDSAGKITFRRCTAHADCFANEKLAEACIRLRIEKDFSTAESAWDRMGVFAAERNVR